MKVLTTPRRAGCKTKYRESRAMLKAFDQASVKSKKPGEGGSYKTAYRVEMEIETWGRAGEDKSVRYTNISQYSGR